ncbi:MAG: DNA-directed RNA polymerase subunit L [Candidatus Bathyarchaeota archaeon]|nr:MAG: DNA-directed RNA polymerase subunit L [Candidatus Bathyarchaeota archaeon]
MKVKVLRRNQKELEIEIEGEGHPLCNVLQEALISDERVDFAGYDIPHPLTPVPRVYVRTARRTRITPEKVLEDAVGEVQKQTEAFQKALAKAFPEQKS